MRPSWRDRHLVYPISGRAFSKDLERSEIKKYNLSYLAIGSQALKLKFKRKEKKANETTNQRARQRPGPGQSASG
jgi:uncharacterized protein (DUF2249 family)